MSDKNILGAHTISDLMELEALAMLLAEQLRLGDIVCLQGDLGAGKTTLTQYVAKALGVQEEITSPTYTILAEYSISNNLHDIAKLIHIDAYRESMDTNYVHEVLRTAESQQAVVVIEWPERLGIDFESNFWNISIALEGEANRRIITISRVE